MDEKRRMLEDTIKHQGRTAYKFSTPMSAPMKFELFNRAPTEQEFNQYEIDMHALDIVTNEHRTLSTDNAKKRGEHTEANVTVRYEYAESCFQCGRTDEIMRTDERTNIREVMGRTPWMDIADTSRLLAHQSW